MESMKDEARLWLYPCNQRLQAFQKEAFNHQLSPFLRNWTTHTQPLGAAFWVGDYELALCVDTQQRMPSGCAIDAWVRTLTAVAKEEGVNCFYYEQLLFKSALPLNKDSNQDSSKDHSECLLSHEEVLQAWRKGLVSGDSLIANVQVSTKGDFMGARRWMPLAKSWFVRRYGLLDYEPLVEAKG